MANGGNQLARALPEWEPESNIAALDGVRALELANYIAGQDAGALDGGLGDCPFAPGCPRQSAGR
jgi:hypothetical protein